MRPFITIAGFFASLLLGSCAVGPNYKTPAPKLEAAFKSAGSTARPPEGTWWVLFEDVELTRLIRLAGRNNPSARAALARYDLARAQLGLSRADTYPAITGDAYARRQGDSRNSNFSSGTFNDYKAALNLSWEIDLWGRVRRQVAAAAADMHAAGYDSQSALLSLEGEVARAYVSLRFADAEIALLDATVKLRAEARRLMKSRFDGGASSRIDHDRSITEHESVVAEVSALRAQRDRFENALAALTGQTASGFHIAPAAAGGLPRIPDSPSAVPSELLRRRPDIAAAERRLAASSERIGVAVASILPRLTLSGEGGVRSLRSSDLFNPRSQLWRLGPEVTVPLFQGGRAGSNKARAQAAYREALENYRDVLLRAVQETEDSLGDAKRLAGASGARKRGAASAERAAALTRERYLGGVSDYFEVVDAERTALSEQRARLSVDLSRSLAATRLIQALGGGWEDSR